MERVERILSHLIECSPTSSETSERNVNSAVGVNKDKRLSFDVDVMWKLLADDNLDVRKELLSILDDPVFKYTKGIALEEEREIALKRLQRVCREPGRFISVNDFKTNPSRIFATHELLGYADGSTATKLTVQFK